MRRCRAPALALAALAVLLAASLSRRGRRPSDAEAEAAEDRGLAEYPGAPLWLVYPWEPAFSSACRSMPAEVSRVLQRAGRDADGLEVVVVRSRHLRADEVAAVSQQALCALDGAAKALGWERPQHEGKMFRLKVVVRLDGVRPSDWLPLARCFVGVVSAIRPFVSPFYSHLPGCIAIMDPPLCISLAWGMVRPLLDKPTLDVVRFLHSHDEGASSISEEGSEAGYA